MCVMDTSEIELRPTEHGVTPDKSTNTLLDETIATASTTPASSPETDTSDIFMIENPIHQSRPVNLLESFNEAEAPQTISIADRIRPTFEIHLSSEEEITHCIIHDINWSFITPIGLQQYDYELKKITVVLSVEELQNLGLGEFVEESRHVRFDEEANLTYDELVEAKKKTNINDRLTFEQWKNLEIALIKSPYGRTVIGYSINEEVYLKFWGHVFQLYYQSLKHLGYPARDYQYPPRKDDAEKLMLDFCQKKTVKDFRLSIQVAGYISWSIILSLLNFFAFLNNQSQNSNFNNLFIHLNSILLYVSCGIFGLAFGFVKLPYFEHNFTYKILSKSCLVSQTYIGNLYRLINYTVLFFPNISGQNLTQTIVYSIPFLAIGSLYLGLQKKDKLAQNTYININKLTIIKQIYHAFDWASYNQSMLGVGSNTLINLAFYFDNFDDSVANEYYAISNYCLYIYLGILFSLHLLNNPLFNEKIRYFALNGCNITNGISYSFHDAWIFFTTIYIPASLSIFKKDVTTKADYLDNALYFTAISLTYLFAIHISFSSTQNIPKYSLREVSVKNDNNHSFFKKTMNAVKSKIYTHNQNPLP